MKSVIKNRWLQPYLVRSIFIVWTKEVVKIKDEYRLDPVNFIILCFDNIFDTLLTHQCIWKWNFSNNKYFKIFMYLHTRNSRYDVEYTLTWSKLEILYSTWGKKYLITMESISFSFSFGLCYFIFLTFSCDKTSHKL